MELQIIKGKQVGLAGDPPVASPAVDRVAVIAAGLRRKLSYARAARLA